MDYWSLIYDNFEPADEGRRESLCALGNGYFFTRGAAPEGSADGIHYPGTYVAGCYNRLTTEIGGQTVEREDLVNLPKRLLLTFRIEGEESFNLQHVQINLLPARAAHPPGSAPSHGPLPGPPWTRDEPHESMLCPYERNPSRRIRS
jgi:hypothetical protein